MKRLSLLAVLAFVVAIGCAALPAAAQAVDNQNQAQASPQQPDPGPGPMMQRPWMRGRRAMPGMRAQGRRFGPGMEARQRFGGRAARMRGFGPGGFGNRGGAGFLMNPRVRQELNLTEQQTTKLRDLQVQQQKSALEQRARMQVKQLELRELLRSESPDRAAAERVINELGDLQKSRMKAQLDQRLAFQQVLTPEQRQKLRDWRERGFGPAAGQPGPRNQGVQPGPRGRRPGARTPAPAPTPQEL